MLLAAVISALLGSFILTLLFTRFFNRQVFLDVPDDQLKKHEQPIPSMGGLGFIIPCTVILAVIFWGTGEGLDPRGGRFFLVLLSSACAMTVIGIIDDLCRLKPVTKLILEGMVIVWIIGSGIRMRIEVLPDWLNIALSVIWLTGVINAVNIIDIMDGLAGGVSAVIALSFAGLGIWTGNTPLVTASLVVGCSVLGFLPHNYPPARIYMGDTGSLFLGLIFGIFSLETSYTRVNDIGFLVPLFLLAVPVFDTVYVSLLRIRQRRSILYGSPDHLALRMAARGVPKENVIQIFYLLQAGCSLLAICIIQVNRWTALAVYLFTMIIAVYLGVMFGSDRWRR